MVEFKENVAGVGALVVVRGDLDRGFLSLRELRSKRSTNKVLGMRTLPMETVEPGEVRLQAWERLVKEEFHVTNFQYDPQEVVQNVLCRCELRPGVMLYASVLQIDPQAEIVAGSESQEVADLRWTQFDDVLSAPQGDLGIRPGMREVIRSYMEYQRDPLEYSPRTYRYSELHDQIPDQIFNLLERGVSLKEALFRSKLASQPSARSVLLAHSQSIPEAPLNFAEAP